jgi:hypothetical protein
VQHYNPELNIVIFHDGIGTAYMSNGNTGITRVIRGPSCHATAPHASLLASCTALSLTSIEDIFANRDWEYTEHYLLAGTTWSNTLNLDLVSASYASSDTAIAWSHDGRILGLFVTNSSDERAGNTLVIYFMETEELRAIHIQEGASDSILQWSPDDQWLTGIGYTWNPGFISVDFAIISIDGQVQAIPLHNEDGERFTVLSTAWIPRGWLQLDELQQ